MNEITEAVVQRLDRLTAVLELAMAPQLQEARAELREDPVCAAIFERLGPKWIASSKLQDAVAKNAKVTTRTVRDRLGQLAERGLVATQGAGTSTEYRSAGIV